MHYESNATRKITLRDIVAALHERDLWLQLAWGDIKLRYRRSKIGPLWITLSMAIFCASLGYVYSHIYKTHVSDYMPFLSSGFIVWGFIATLTNEFCNVYMDNGSYIKDMRLNPFTLLFRLAARNSMILFHNLIIIVGVYMYFELTPNWNILWFIPGFAAVLMNLLAIGVSLSMIGARFRDVGPIVQNVIQLLFFISPITWFPHLISESNPVLLYNPITYLLDLMRAPLLSTAPESISWQVAAGLFCATSLVAYVLYEKKSRSIPFWV